MVVNLHKHLSWKIVSAAIAALIFFPLLSIIFLASNGSLEVWAHLSATVLNDYIQQSIILMLSVGTVTLFIGVGSAWLVTQYQFPLVKLLHWTLLLPLAMPAYITAYTYTGLFDFYGPVQGLLRNTFNWSYGDYWFPGIRSMGGAIFVMSFVLYPYIYLLARAAFIEQSHYLKQTAQLMGYSERQAFFKVTLPIARPPIIAGLSLVLMETLADYGTVHYFGVTTFTTGIFRTWFGLGEAGSAAQLSLVLLLFVLLLLVLEKHSRKQAKFYTSSNKNKPDIKRLTGYKAAIATLLCCLPIVLGFLLPTIQLSVWAIKTAPVMIDTSFWQLLFNTVLLASITAIAAASLALIITYSKRLSPSPTTYLSTHISTLGYAIPGTVIAVGTLVPLAWIDNHIDAWFRLHMNISTGLILSGTLFALVIAYLVRFLAVSVQTVDAGLYKIKPSMDQAAQSLGYKPNKILKLIHFPILRTSLLTALLIVFVDVMKELPATLIMRPFNFNTLAVRAYELASDERLADASTAALAIVLAGLIPIVLLTRAINNSTISK